MRKIRDRRPFWEIAAAALLCLSVGARGNEVSGANDLISREIPIVETELPNGLQVAVQEDHSSPIVAVRIYVKTGSIYEGEYTGAGISHYFEHLMSGGTTTTRSEAESAKILRALGGMSNAYTSKNHTCFYINTSSENFVKALELLSDWVMNCALDPAEVDRERGVISEEIRMGENEPGRVVMRLFYETAFRIHPERLPVIGYLENFLRLTRDDLVSYYRKHYVPNNMLLVVAGDVDPGRVIGEAGRVFGKFERKPLPPKVLPSEPPQLGLRTAQKAMPTNVAYLVMGLHTVDIYSDDVYPLDLISFIASNGRSSRLYRKVREEKRLVFSVDSWSYTPAYDVGIFGIFAVADPGKVEEAQWAILDELKHLQVELVSDEELAKAKRQKISELVMGMQTMEGRAERLGIDIITTGDPYFSWKYTKRIQEVTKEQIHAAASKYFSRENLAAVVVKPPVSGPVSGEEQVGEEGKAGAIKEVKLANGMKVLIKSVPTVPVVSIQAHCKGGVRYETAETNGAFNLMSRMLLRGTASRSWEDIAGEIDLMGATIGTLSGNNSFNVSVLALNADFRRVLELLADIIMRPAFPEEYLEKERATLIARIRQERDNWDSEALRLYRSAMFRTHPYGLNPLGSIEAVSSVTREDVVSLYESYCAPDNMVLAIFGAVDEETAEQAVREVFGEFERKSAAPPEVPAEPALTEEIKSVSYNEQTQAVVAYGFRGTTLGGEDRYVLSVIDALISGIGFPAGRLHEALRVKRDLVYFVHAVNWTGIDPGSFYAIAQTAPENADQVTSIIRDEFQRITSEKVSEEELELAKKVCVTSFEMYRQTNGEQAQEAALFELYGLGYDHEEKYPERVREVTTEDVLRVARRYFQKPRVLVITRPKPAEE